MKKQFDSPVKREGGVKLILRMKRHSPVLDDVLAKGRDAQQVRLLGCLQPADIGLPSGNGKKLSYSQAQLGRPATRLLHQVS